MKKRPEKGLFILFIFSENLFQQADVLTVEM